MTELDDAVGDAAALVAAADRVVVFTGAGMSAESGVPTFRDALSGLWERFRPEDLATPQAWRRDRATVWGWYADRAAALKNLTPNAGHFAIARLGERKAASNGSVLVVTQNVDELHERGGSQVASHLHGSLFEPRCESCSTPAGVDCAVEPELVACRSCGATVRPGVVWFGEALPGDAWAAARSAFASADLVLVVGTSGVVYPAAELPEEAAFRGVPIVEVNPEPSGLTGMVTRFVPSTAAAALPAIVG